MTDKLPPNLLQLFAPRPPLRWMEPTDHPPEKRQTPNIGGIGQYMQALREYKDNDGYVPSDSWLQTRDRKKLEKKERQEWLLTEGVKQYNPKEDPKVEGDAFKTLFVARLSYSITPEDLEREFGRFGPIERIRIVEDVKAPADAPAKKRKRGYAFIVFEREKDMKAAYKETDGMKIKDRRVLVDVERGRAVHGWRPRRFGGGLGGRGYTKGPPARPGLGAGPGPSGFGPPAGPGGFGGRGGFGGGGFRGGRGGFGGDRGGFGGRGGFAGPPRGGAGFGGPPRGAGIGYQPSNGFAPDGAPSGPRGGGRSGFGDRGGDRGSFGGDRGPSRYPDEAPRGYGDRNKGSSGANNEPLGRERDPRDSREPRRERDGGYGGGGRDGRDDRDRDSRKRPFEGGDSFDDSRTRRRY